MRTLSLLFLLVVFIVPAAVDQMNEAASYELHLDADEGSVSERVMKAAAEIRAQDHVPDELDTEKTLQQEKQKSHEFSKFRDSETENQSVLTFSEKALLNRINQMPLEAWMEIKGIGQVTAERIMNYKNENKGFSALEDLLEVKGIGPSKYAAILSWLDQTASDHPGS